MEKLKKYIKNQFLQKIKGVCLNFCILFLLLPRKKHTYYAKFKI